MLIEKVGWKKVSVAIYDAELNQMVHYGWVELEEGYTLDIFDWEEFIARKTGENN